jgi:hypothetical protein
MRWEGMWLVELRGGKKNKTKNINIEEEGHNAEENARRREKENT